MSSAASANTPQLRTLGPAGVAVAATALVVSGSTLVTDFTGFMTLGAGFTVSLAIGLLIVVPVVLSASDLAVTNPVAGGIYHYARTVIRGSRGRAAGLFLAMVFLGAFLTGASGETMTGAHALRSLVRSDAHAGWFAMAIVAAAVIPNLLGLRRAAWITGALLAAMLGIRWLFGVAGFLGVAGDWDPANLIPSTGLQFGGAKGILIQGIALGFWCFVGIEGACGLAEETRDPRRSIPRGLILALLCIFATTLVMGLGVAGALPHEQWREIAKGVAGAGGSAPHLAIGGFMLGPVGRDLMAVASIASTLSTLLIALAAVPRMIAALARDRLFPAAVSDGLARVHHRTGAPMLATLVVAAALVAVTCAGRNVIESLCGAAYLWFFRHLVIHALAFANRLGSRDARGVLGRVPMMAVAAFGAVASVTAFCIGFDGSHALHAPKALTVVAIALMITAVSLATRRPAVGGRTGQVSLQSNGSAFPHPPPLRQYAQFRPDVLPTVPTQMASAA